MSGASAPQGLADSPLNFIYACSVCCTTFADAYEGHNETVHGLSDGINPKGRLVSKLYLGNCCHVFCGEHLEGGGPPFHPAGQKPKAPCPVCVKEHGDSTARELYSIRGFRKDEYDPAIPPIWFKAPPIDLGGNTKETEALRFQYLALVRYCQTSYRTRKPLSKALADTKEELATMQHRLTDEHSKVETLQRENEKLRASAQQMEDMETLRTKVERLQHLEQEVGQFNADLAAFRRLKADVRDLDVFRQNKTAILQHLKLVPKLVEQNEKMKNRLASLGFAMALEPIPNHSQLTSDDLDEIGNIAGASSEDGRRFQKSSSTHTAGRSAHTSGHGAVAHPFASSDRPMKRQRIDSPLPRDMDIEPPRLIPSLRKKFSSGRTIPKGYRNHNGDVQMYDKGHWRNAEGSCIDDDMTSPSHDMRSETPYMTGALPVESALHESHGFISAEPHTNASDFTFRASSPVKMSGGKGDHQPVQLPTGPSYLHLMDGLSRDNGFDLGLKDPRQAAQGQYQTNNTVRPPVITPQSQRQTLGSHSQQRWGLGHAFLHQSPNGPPKLVDQQPSPLFGNSNGHFNRAQYEPSLAVSTPAANQLQQPVHQIENVFKSFRRLSVTKVPNFTSDPSRVA
ncbi:hypothetical protein EJ07DRAFT_166647 [Lizonia empirigonia]|nr:hypothetical protein EJ07DRAFT_166647 [Lizonia empirigonia]